MDKCPKCGERAYLYKELLPEGKAQICCCNTNGCDWKSEPIDRHEHIPTLGELRRNWQ